MSAGAKQQGFSLLELIVVIVLLGVMAGGAGLLITKPIEAYNAQVRRAQLVDQAEMALRQIARDVRRALPNSIRIDTTTIAPAWALEMVNTVDGARYRDENQDLLGTNDQILNFTTADTQFNFLGQLQTLTAFNADHRIVIYNTNSVDIYLAAVASLPAGIITPENDNLPFSLTLAVDPGTDAYISEDHVTMNPAFQFTQQSPGQRAFIVDGPISYICDPVSGNMTRYSNYAYQVAQPTAAPVGDPGGLVVSSIANPGGCIISYQAGSSQRGGIVTLGISLDDAGESVTLLHQVHVVNVP